MRIRGVSSHHDCEKWPRVGLIKKPKKARALVATRGARTARFSAFQAGPLSGDLRRRDLAEPHSQRTAKQAEPQRKSGPGSGESSAASDIARTPRHNTNCRRNASRLRPESLLQIDSSTVPSQRGSQFGNGPSAAPRRGPIKRPLLF